MKNTNKVPIVISTVLATCITAGIGSLSMQNSSITSKDKLAADQEAMHAQNQILSVHVMSQIEEFTRQLQTDTGSGFTGSDGSREDANGNDIPPTRTEDPSKDYENTEYEGSNEILKLATDAWNDYCNEGGVYSSSVTGNVTHGRHDCSGFVYYALAVKGGMQGIPAQSGVWWAGPPAGFTAVDGGKVYSTLDELNAAVKEGDIMSYSGHVQISAGPGMKISWGGYGSDSRYRNIDFPFNKPIPCPTTNRRVDCKLYRKTGG